MEENQITPLPKKRGGPQKGKPINDLTGRVFGKLTVLGFSRRDSNRCPFWRCRCVCGNEIDVRGQYLLAGKRTACKRACRFESMVGKRGMFECIKQVENPLTTEGKIRSGRWWECVCTKCGRISVRPSRMLTHAASCQCVVEKLPNNLSAFHSLVSTYAIRAEDRGIEFTLSKEECHALFSSNCHYCGIKPKQISKSNSSIFLYNGIDRVDSSKGYIQGNVVPCCKLCNHRKGKMELGSFLKWISDVYEKSIKPLIQNTAESPAI